MLDDDDSDSSEASNAGEFNLDNDPDAREERALFEDPYQRKRRRKNGKEDALYGVFAEDSDEDIRGGGRGPAGKQKRADWTKAPAFVSGEKKVDLKKDMDTEMHEHEDTEEDDDGEDDGSEGEDETADEYSDESEPSRPPSPRIRGEDEPPGPQLSGIGLGTGKFANVLPSFSKGGIGSSNTATTSETSSKGGIGSSTTAQTTSRSGIGSSRTNSSNTVSSGSGSAFPAPQGLPSTFGSQSQRSFVRDETSAKTSVPLSAAEQAHFNKLQGTFGARMLAKMGWQAGTGLGVTGDGIVAPVESKLRPKKAGIAFQGFKEKTEQSKMEARRKGEVVSDDEDVRTKKFRKKMKEQEEKRSDVWKRKKVKTKIEHKTYEQIVAEAGQELPSSGIGQIIDATGAVVRLFHSLVISINLCIITSLERFLPSPMCH